MSSHRRQRSPSPDRRPSAVMPKIDKEDLITILDRNQRADLAVLVSQITESMRNAILNNLSDSTDTQQQSNEAIEKDRLKSYYSYENAPQTYSITNDRVGNQQGDLAFEIRYPKLRRDAIRYFDTWRDSVVLRVGEIINKPNIEAIEEPTNLAAKGGMSKEQGTLRKLNKLEKLDQLDEGAENLRMIYTPLETPLVSLPVAKKLLILHSILLLLLSLEHYNALSRVLLLYITSSLKLSERDLSDYEAKVARTLLDTAVMMSADEDTREKAEQGRTGRKWKVALASVAGAALIGITGGLAAPLIAAGIGTAMGGLGLGATAAAGYLGTLASSGVIVGGLFGAYGGRMTGRMMDKYAREVEDFAFIPIRGSNHRHDNEKEVAYGDHRLRVTIGISGWATNKNDVIIPWRVISSESEVFALRWELQALSNLGSAIETLVTSAAWTLASRELLARTIFAQVMSAVLLPLGLMKLASIVDNPFSVAKARADKAGEVLADALINKAQGERPVSLVGYSLGSRVIYSCLQNLAKRYAFGLVDTVILMGSPIPSSRIAWCRMRSVVCGRLVNVYSKNDAVLALLYRASSAQFGIAGVQAISDILGVENVDASDLISGHLKYRYLIGKILMKIGFDETDPEEMTQEVSALKVHNREERERTHNERQADMESLTNEPETKTTMRDSHIKDGKPTDTQ